MRLIDADVLIEIIKEEKEDNDAHCRLCMDTTVDIIDEQLTIEAKPVVHGEWAHLGGDEWCCSECGHVITTEGSWEKPKMKFCEECGADMRKVEENETI